ncbi:Serine carboxypeptidase-like 17 [Glycine soja]
MVKVWKPWCVLISVLHLFLHTTSSDFIVKNLPGFGDLPFTLNTGHRSSVMVVDSRSSIVDRQSSVVGDVSRTRQSPIINYRSPVIDRRSPITVTATYIYRYIGVGQREEVQLYYYFVESQRSPLNDPLLLWLVGGPGCSAHSAFFYENGPLMFNFHDFNGSFPQLLLNPHTWTKVLNILYVDAPVGTGYSYSKTQEGYYSNDEQLVEHMYDFFHKWLVDHPEFRSNPLYIGGGSYSGIVVLPLVQKVYEDYETGRSPILNIQGLVLASPRLDSFMDNNTKVEFAHQRTLISNELYESIKSNCNGDYVNLDPNNTKCMSDYEAYTELVRYINEYQILEPSCVIAPKENQRILSQELNYILQTKFRCRDDLYAIGELWANDPHVQKALQVRESLNLKFDMTWHPWFVDGQVAGYAEEYKKSEYHLTYAIVKIDRKKE